MSTIPWYAMKSGRARDEAKRLAEETGDPTPRPPPLHKEIADIAGWVLPRWLRFHRRGRNYLLLDWDGHEVFCSPTRQSVRAAITRLKQLRREQASQGEPATQQSSPITNEVSPCLPPTAKSSPILG